MVKEAVEFLQGKGYDISPEEIHRQNRLAIRYFAIAGLPVAIANVFAQVVVRGPAAFDLKSVLLLCYFLLLLVLERFFLPPRYERSTLLVYLIEAPVMVISILLGTIWDPTHQAITFPMFMAVIPIFIFDAPVRVAGVSLGWNAIFLALVSATKDPAIVANDYVHAAEFYFVSLAVTIIVLRLRAEVVYNLDRANYHLHHDVLTNTRNRLSLEAHAPDYAETPLFVAMADVDHFALINDFYGKLAGDAVVGTLAETVKEVFEPKDVYRYSSDDLLCIARCHEDAGLALIDDCRARLADARFEGVSAQITYSFGYVVGTPDDADELSNMIQLANIYAHQAKREGVGKTVGGSFSDEALRAGIVEANIGMHARSYEINQLTGLPTMQYFVVHSEELLNTVVDHARRPVIGYLNIVHFRSYNERYGYEEGDELIRALGHALGEVLPTRHVAYVTGSKFVLMCYLEEIEPAMLGLNALLRTHRPEFVPSVRGGFAEHHEGDSVISLVDRARMAHAHVDGRHPGLYRLYDTQLDDEIRLRQYLVDHLDQALAEGWLDVYYQPIVWSSNGKLCNLEALSRWIDPIYGFLAPGQFIATLEREHLIYKLSLHVIRRALADLARMGEAGMELVPVSVNLSRDDFLACDMVEEVSAIVEQSGLPPHLLSIEITESAFAESEELLRSEVDRFRERGFAVWMDDFGSEYSTLNLLEDLNFDLVKLDMRFMRHFDAEGKNAIIVSSVIDMCHRLGMTALVEGVETTDQAELLSDMGSDKHQGYLYSRPLPFAQVLELAKAKGW